MCHGPRYRLRPRTRIFALRKSARAASRWRWLSCYHGSRRPGCRMSRDMGDAVGTALGAREYERARHLRIGKQICQQRALLVRFDVDHALRDAIEPSEATGVTVTFTGSRNSSSASWGDLPRHRAEKNRFCRRGDSWATIRRIGLTKPWSSI